MQREFQIIIKILCVALFIEFLLFNYRHWESLLNKEVKEYSVQISEGMETMEDGTYRAGAGEKYLKFSNIDTKLSTLFLDIEPVDRGKDNFEPVTIELWARDDGHEEYYRIPSRELWHMRKKSQYLTCHFYGDCKSLKLVLNLPEGERFRIHYFLNPVIPIFFSWLRVLAVFGVVAFCYAFRPSSFIYRISFIGNSRIRKRMMIFLLAGNMALLFSISGLNPVFQKENEFTYQKGYQRLARALAGGQFSLLEEPGEVLKGMENPYDYMHREKILKEAGESYLWDHVYYEGKYYIYFGVVPAVLFYLPYYLLTGEDLSNRAVILIGTFVLLTAIIGLTYQVIKRWFPKTSVGAWFLLTELIVGSSRLIYMCKRTDMYTVPIITGLGFGFLGLLFFMCAQNSYGKISWQYIAAGSFFLALVIGCRPQIFVMILPAAVILRKNFSGLSDMKVRDKIRAAAAFVIPFLSVAVLLMWYNYSRFGSPFDFGSNYNLTFNDMRKRGFVPDRIPLGIWAYLLAPVKIRMNFPFLTANYFDTNYLGVTITEATYGGLFAVSLFVWTCPLLMIFKKYIRKSAAADLAFASILAGAVIILMDTEMSGILPRYFCDFSIFFLFAAFLAWLALYEHTKGVLRKGMLLFLAASFLAMIVYEGVFFFPDTQLALEETRRDLFSAVKYQVMFWL